MSKSLCRHRTYSKTNIQVFEPFVFPSRPGTVKSLQLQVAERLWLT